MEPIGKIIQEQVTQKELLQKPPQTLPGVSDKINRGELLVKTYPFAKDMIVAFNHGALRKKYWNIRTVAQAYETNYIKLNEIGKAYGEDAPVMLIESWLMQLALFLNIEIDADRIKETAWLIYDDNHFLNIAELTLLFTRIKKGYFGEFYGSIDPSALLRWCREYRKDRGLYISKLP